MKKIILNADDFGRHEKINEAVKKACETGALRSATLMPTGKAFDDAINIAKNTPALGIGIHLTLIDDTPLSPPKDIPSLVKDGKFYPNYLEFLKAFLAGRISREDIKTELAAQFQKMDRAGVKFTHIDSHQHLHHIPGILEMALNLAERSGIKKVRISHTSLFTGEKTNVKQFVGRFGLFYLANYAKIVCKIKNFKYPDNFLGIVAGDAVTEDFLIGAVNSLKDGVTEVMMHPATDNASITAISGWEHDFIVEFKAASSEKFLNILRDNNIDAVNYNDIENN